MNGFLVAERRLSLARLLWSLKIKCNNVGAGFPRPTLRSRRWGGENPPLRQVTWLRLIFKDHQPTGRLAKVPASRERRLNSLVADATRRKNHAAPWVETHG